MNGNYLISVYIIDSNKNLVEKANISYASMTPSVTTSSNLTVVTLELANDHMNTYDLY